MGTHDDNNRRSLEELEQELRRELDRVELELGSALDLRADAPDRNLENFERLTADLEATLHDLGHSLAELSATTPTDLNRLASRTLQEVLVDIEKPLVLRVQWGEELPSPTVSPEPLRSLIARVLSLVGRFASAGDVVLVETTHDADDVVLRIQLEPTDPRGSIEASRQLGRRESALKEFVSDFGGRFEIEHDAGGPVRMNVRLPVGAAQQ